MKWAFFFSLCRGDKFTIGKTEFTKFGVWWGRETRCLNRPGVKSPFKVIPPWRKVRTKQPVKFVHLPTLVLKPEQRAELDRAVPKIEVSSPARIETTGPSC